ncbi:glycerate kinase [Segniliparus rugosus]|uniref:Glycerate kinase n=1 Tax=Segniliparus rugosus (strain ATCC BAA-974 / DSM 45345 / CCUG 50838 / CIP 108380 / JCM 13579 / CDC 945) TaxID=679197 RepID=E5XL66_SEGRC|nr:glycerate kinase [Segniliparus rugosus]EFV14934.2 glycerate kinase [Segniliparus rugosus ATCC BAA-974]
MRVVIAPDSFGGTLSSAQAARAIAEGWSAARPADELALAPQSDGGPGFVSVLAAQFGSRKTTFVQGPLGAATKARWLIDAVGDSEHLVAYLECAQACGLHLLDGPPTPETALAAHSRGVGQLIVDAVDYGATTIVVGLGGSSCTDAGAGMLAVLGGLAQARGILAGVGLIAATDVEHPLLGPSGAARVFGPQKGADAATVKLLEARLSSAAAEFQRVVKRDVASLPGAGAAGGLGAALFALGASRRSGAELIAERTGQSALLARADLVITGEGRLDDQSVRGKVVSALAKAAARAGARTIALAGQVRLDPAQARIAGIADAYSMSEFAGSVDLALTDAENQLRKLAEHVAANWTVANTKTANH